MNTIIPEADPEPSPNKQWRALSTLETGFRYDVYTVWMILPSAVYKYTASLLPHLSLSLMLVNAHRA